VTIDRLACYYERLLAGIVERPEAACPKLSPYDAERTEAGV